jgi:hypothetical protein
MANKIVHFLRCVLLSPRFSTRAIWKSSQRAVWYETSYRCKSVRRGTPTPLHDLTDLADLFEYSTAHPSNTASAQGAIVALYRSQEVFGRRDKPGTLLRSSFSKGGADVNTKTVWY